MKDDRVYLNQDRAIHNYFEIDLEIVWQTVQKDVPELKGALRNFLV